MPEHRWHASPSIVRVSSYQLRQKEGDSTSMSISCILHQPSLSSQDYRREKPHSTVGAQMARRTGHIRCRDANRGPEQGSWCPRVPPSTSRCVFSTQLNACRFVPSATNEFLTAANVAGRFLHHRQTQSNGRAGCCQGSAAKADVQLKPQRLQCSGAPSRGREGVAPPTARVHRLCGFEVPHVCRLAK